MAEQGPRIEDLDPPGLAGGPGPTPPGLDDGTPKPVVEGPGVATPPRGGEKQAGTGEPQGTEQRARVACADPEEPDPS